MYDLVAISIMFVVVASETSSLEPTAKTICVTVIVQRNTGRTVTQFKPESGSCLSAKEASAAVNFIFEHAAAGIPVVTFNGTGYDFRHLAAAGAQADRVETLAMLTQDLFLDFCTEHGYFSSLNAFCAGLGLPKRPPPLTDASVADHVNRSERVANVLANVVQYAVDHKKLYRLTATGKKSLWVSRGGIFRSAMRCIEEFESNPVVPSWMDSPPDITSLWNWI